MGTWRVGQKEYLKTEWPRTLKFEKNRKFTFSSKLKKPKPRNVKKTTATHTVN